MCRATTSQCVALALHGQGPLAANVTFSSIFLENNQLIINQGQMLTLTAANLKATYANKVEGDLSFWVSELVHGQFEYVALPHQPIVVFQQQNITDGLVRFIHDQSLYAPAYQIAVSNGAITTPPQPAWIDFDTIPLLLTNQLVINQGQSVLLTAAMLNATHPGAAIAAICGLILPSYNKVNSVGSIILLPSLIFISKTLRID